ncbi:hypothetical protein TNCV_4503621 [Trichonephila clavipes]|nr:hypothetical protein TNCV_4503621 [Trichonephila clavipes]
MKSCGTIGTLLMTIVSLPVRKGVDAGVEKRDLKAQIEKVRLLLPRQISFARKPKGESFTTVCPIQFKLDDFEGDFTQNECFTLDSKKLISKS